MLKLSSFFLIIFVTILIIVVQCDGKPNVVIIMADDMGSYDASFRGSDQILTPNIDALGYHGVTFDRFYTPPMCTPSRSSLMTGNYPHTVGMQNWVVQADEAFGLGLEEKLISNYFKEAGYRTHLVGKWHLGYYQKQYTPTYRGFDSFYGYYNGLVDYYNFTYIQPPFTGYDFRNQTEVYKGMKPGSYATDLFNDEAVKIIKSHDEKTKNPLFLMLNHVAPHTGTSNELMQAPKEEIAKFNYITDPNRRILAAMISKLDESVGKVVEALRLKGILENTIILFYSDNGAPTAGLFGNYGSNHPLRGQKDSAWEGASRNLGLIYSPLIKKNQRVFDGYFHTADILPTLASAAGIKIAPGGDGIDQWDALVNGGRGPRNDVVTALDNIRGHSGIIYKQWKLVNGTTINGDYDAYLGTIQEVSIPSITYTNTVLSSRAAKALASIKQGKLLTAEQILRLRKKLKVSCHEVINPITSCNPLIAPCLFNIVLDPCERNNLAKVLPVIFERLRKRLINLVNDAAPARRIAVPDDRCNPANFNGTWSWWGENAV